MKIRQLQNLTYIVMLYLLLSSCGKEFLDIKRESNQVVPSSIADYQAILDNQRLLTITSHRLSSLGGDEYYIKADFWKTLIGNYAYERNAYIWGHDVFEGSESLDWNWPHQRIQYANMALEVNNTKPLPNEKDAWNEVKGGAFFHRAWNFYQLAQLFCKPYDKNTAHSELGIPLRLDYDVAVKVGRGTLAETYDQIIKDLKEAESLLPVQVITKFRPSLVAVYALLARVYLNMENYELAEQYSNLALEINSDLLDYSDLEFKGMFAFSGYEYGKGNPEVIFYSYSINAKSLGYFNINVDADLFDLYELEDLRRKAFFHFEKDGRIGYKGSYNGSDNLFSGFTTGELLLVNAECKARLGRFEEGIAKLNYLRYNRLAKSAFNPIVALNRETALKSILEERRKELYLRGVRWEDLRRLNKNPETKVTLMREIDGQKYELKPNDSRWVWPIPDNEIRLNGLKQNAR